MGGVQSLGQSPKKNVFFYTFPKTSIYIFLDFVETCSPSVTLDFKLQHWMLSHVMLHALETDQRLKFSDHKKKNNGVPMWKGELHSSVGFKDPISHSAMFPFLAILKKFPIPAFSEQRSSDDFVKRVGHSFKFKVGLNFSSEENKQEEQGGWRQLWWKCENNSAFSKCFVWEFLHDFTSAISLPSFCWKTSCSKVMNSVKQILQLQATRGTACAERRRIPNRFSAIHRRENRLFVSWMFTTH